MEEIASILNSVSIVLTAVLGGLGVISLSVCALLYMNAHGDPQQINKAKAAGLGAVIGLILGGMAWVLPGTISRAIVEPAGGQSLSQSGSVQGCDQLLRSQLVNQRQVNSTSRINSLISVIQSRRDNCRPDLWRPKAYDLDNAASDMDTLAGAQGQSCFRDSGTATPAGFTTYKTAPNPNTWSDAAVNDVLVPIGLRRGGDPEGVPLNKSSRDQDNNIIVFFENARLLSGGHGLSARIRVGGPPSDGASCWLYVARSSAWFSGGAAGPEDSSTTS